jgi:hypothetical protein
MKRLLLVVVSISIVSAGFAGISYVRLMQWTDLSDNSFRAIVAHRGYITYSSIRFPESQIDLAESMLEQMIADTRDQTKAYVARDHVWWPMNYQDLHNWNIGPLCFELLAGPGPTMRRIIIIPSLFTVIVPLMISVSGLFVLICRTSKRSHD